MNQKFTLSSVEQCYICFFQISTIITMKKAKKKERIVDMILKTGVLWQQKNKQVFGGITWRQFTLLETLRDISDQSVSLARLSEEFGGTRQNVRQLVNVLCEKGFISRKPSPTNSHTNDLTLTDAATKFMDEHKGLGDALLSPVFKGINEKTLDTTLDCLKDMLRNLESLSAEKATTESAMPSEKSARE